MNDEISYPNNFFDPYEEELEEVEIDGDRQREDEIESQWERKYSKLKLANPDLDDKGIMAIWNEYDAHGAPK